MYDHMFPIRGKHDIGDEGAGFGAGRTGHSHQGQDVFARCGTPMVAARAGKVMSQGLPLGGRLLHRDRRQRHGPGVPLCAPPRARTRRRVSASTRASRSVRSVKPATPAAAISTSRSVLPRLVQGRPAVRPALRVSSAGIARASHEATGRLAAHPTHRREPRRRLGVMRLSVRTRGWAPPPGAARPQLRAMNVSAPEGDEKTTFAAVPLPKTSTTSSRPSKRRRSYQRDPDHEEGTARSGA